MPDTIQGFIRHVNQVVDEDPTAENLMGRSLAFSVLGYVMAKMAGIYIAEMQEDDRRTRPDDWETLEGEQ
jgi:hypothetical protein